MKFSVLFLYRRIFPQAGFKSVLTWYGYFVLLYTVIFLVLDIFHCQPVSQAWHSENDGSCLNMDTIWIVGGSLNALTDIGALCLPMPLLWRLHVGLEKRIQLMGVFLLGGFVCVVSIIRVVELGGLSSSDESCKLLPMPCTLEKVSFTCTMQTSIPQLSSGLQSNLVSASSVLASQSCDRYLRRALPTSQAWIANPASRRQQKPTPSKAVLLISA